MSTGYSAARCAPERAITNTDRKPPVAPDAGRQRWRWFLLLWIAGVLAVGAAAYLLRFVLALVQPD
jgi:hypothetical protein